MGTVTVIASSDLDVMEASMTAEVVGESMMGGVGVVGEFMMGGVGVVGRSDLGGTC